MKPMIKNSNLEGRFTESRGRWKCGKWTRGEWTYEGGQMRLRKKADGSRTRYQHGPYAGTG